MTHAYFDLTARQWEEALGLMVQWLLRARQRLGAPSNTPAFDEDVNIYLGHLLLAAFDPRYRELCNRYVASRDIDVFQQAAHTDLPQLKSLIYRLNADHLLLIVSVFRPPPARTGPATPAGEEAPRAAQEGYGRTYYRFAAAYAKQRQPSSPGVSEVLDKLSGDFDKYAQVLTEVRQDYFHFLESIARREFGQLLDELAAHERRLLVRRLRDAFLDAYSQWRRSPAPAQQQRLTEAAEALRRADPTFQYTPPAPPTTSTPAT